MKWKGTTFEERFLSRIEKHGPVINEELGNCWDWIGRVGSNGYGIAPRNKWKIQSAHRLSFKFHYTGEDIDNIFVCHKCDRRLCVNPDHLFLGTHEDNMKDMKLKGRAACGKRNGKHTHPEKISKGNDHYLTRNWTKEDIIRIRNLYESGLSQSEIAKRFNITRPVIGSILNGKHWSIKELI